MLIVHIDEKINKKFTIVSEYRNRGESEMAKKRQKLRHQNGFGSIVKLSGRRRKPYGVRITVGWEDGKQIRKYLGYYSSEVDALLALAEYHKNGVDIDLTNLTLKEIFERWLQIQENRTLSRSALATHKMAYNRLGKLGNLPIKTVKTTHLQKWLDEIDLKPATKGKLRSTMGMVFEYATQNDIVSKNYAKYLKIDEKIEKIGKVFTEEEIQELWKHAQEEEGRILLILIYTGMRIGELLDITKDDVNWDKQYMVGGSKTEAGRNRIIPLHRKIVPLVKQQLGDNHWMVQTVNGGKTLYNTVSFRNAKFLTHLGMEHKFHDTRKTAISLMHTAGIPMETIKLIVGHSGSDVTEKVYLYKHPEELVKIINILSV